MEDNEEDNQVEKMHNVETGPNNFNDCTNHKETGLVEKKFVDNETETQNYNSGYWINNEEITVMNTCTDCIKPSVSGHSNINESKSESDLDAPSELPDSKPDSIYTSESEDSLSICVKCAELEKQLQEVSDSNEVMKEKCKNLFKKCEDCQFKVENIMKERDSAIKDKETMVMRYAVSEKNVLEQKCAKEILEKKYKELNRENEILQHKVNQMGNEKARIAQMFDNKCHDLKQCQQEVDHTKADLSALETKLKWLQNNLKSEIDMRKDNEAKMEMLNIKLQESTNQLEQTKKEAQENIKTFHTSQENRAYILDQQLKEQQAILIMLKHEKADKNQQMKTLQRDLERIQNKQKETLQENNELSLKVQQLERDRLDAEQKLSDLRGYADQQKQDAADLVSKNVQLEQIKLQLKNEQEQLSACNEQISLLKHRNSELESDMESCRVKEAELLLFTQQLTDKNIRLQSEFTAMETKVQQLTCEQTLLKRAIKEQETKASILATQLSENHKKYLDENEKISLALIEKTKICECLTQEVADQKGENVVLKRKLELSLREANKELNQYRKKLEHYENTNTSSSSSSTSLNGATNGESSPTTLIDHVKVVQPERVLDKQALIEHIVKLQRVSARKSEKIDFLEEHVNTLIAELQKKSRLLHSYILREQSGALSSNSMDSNKANLAKFHGVMASMYGSRVADNNLTLELSLDINRKLQAVLEDALLENITLKENVDTLGAEIDKLNKMRKT